MRRRGSGGGPPDPDPVRVVMLGGGYATLHAYRALTSIWRRGSRPVRITVVSADDCHNFHGFTGEVVAGVLPLEITRTPLATALGSAEFVHGEAVRVDRRTRTVVVRQLGGRPSRILGYDQLIVATGGREPLDRVPGMAEHGFTLRAPGEFHRWLGRLTDLLEAGTHRPTADDGAPVVITGGGMAGVELAAAVADRLRAAGAANAVLLCQSALTVLPALRREHPRVAARAERELARLGVQVRAGSAVVAVHRNAVTLSDGTRHPATAVLATTGQRPSVLPGLDDLPRDAAGRLVVDATLRVAPGIWAAGDAARVCHPRTGEPVAANALWAIKAGAALGRNVSRVVHDREARPLRYRGLGQAMAFGLGRSATELYGVPIPGVIGWVLRLGFFLRFMPERRRAVRVLAILASTPWRGRFPLPSRPGTADRATSLAG